MKLELQQLHTHLKKNLFPIYIIAGEEPLLVQEACNDIKTAARQADFQERTYFEITKEFNWDIFQIEATNLSLFSQKSLLELRLLVKPNATGSLLLQNFAENVQAEKILLITMEKCDATTQKTKWFQTLNQKGVFIQIWPLDAKNILPWIKHRLQQFGLSTDAEGIHYLAQYTEGNLLATAQEIQKLQLLYGEGHLTSTQISTAISDNAKFNVFALADEILGGHISRALRIFYRLREEGTEPLLILWAITRELRTLLSLHTLLTSGMSSENAFKRLKIWTKKQSAYKKALQLIKINEIHQMLLQTQRIDCMLKGALPGNAWDEISQLICAAGRVSI